jgi:Domain of unknown function (DUF1906)
MRRIDRRFGRALLAVGVVVGLVVLPAGSLSAQSAPGSGARQVQYGGATFKVPSDWPVLDLAANPQQCVRFDTPAVYLGHEGTNPLCPAHLVGRSDGVLVEPLDASTAVRAARATAATTINGEAAKVDPAPGPGTTTTVFSRVGLVVTLSRGENPSVIDDVLKSWSTGSPTPTAVAPAVGAPAAVPAPASTSPAVGSATAVPTSRGAVNYTGEGFDACTAPSEATMDAWLSSPYRSVGVYIGGAVRACAQPNLTSTWVTDETGKGWALVPTYVGLQAPCNSSLFGVSFTINPQQADPQGRAAADDAVANAATLGLAAGSPIYFDMEGYSTSTSGCSQTVLAFLNAWTGELHVKGYTSGIYGSSSSMMVDLVKNYGSNSFNTPDDIWFANWGCCPNMVTGDGLIPSADWSPHHRLHQYQGGHNETWGGVAINVDSDYNDGDLVGGVPGYVLDGWGAAHPFAGAPFLYGTMYVPGQDIARGLVLRPGGGGGYVLDDWGGIHPFGNAPGVYGDGYFPGRDMARALVLNPCDATGTSGYMLDAWGGVHPFGGAPGLYGTGWWPGWDIARSIALTCRQGTPAGYVMEGWGGLHPIGQTPEAVGEAYWSGFDIAVTVVLNGPTSGYTLDGWGGVHPFGGAPGLEGSAYWPGTHTAKGLALDAAGTGGYVVDINGGIHRFGDAPSQNASTFSGAIARGIVLAG